MHVRFQTSRMILLYLKIGSRKCFCQTKNQSLPDSAALHSNFHNEGSRMPQEMLRACSLSLIAFQHLHNRGKCIPIARSYRYSEDVVDRAEVSNGFHLATVHTENKFV